jgi:hypothetical protein
MSQDVILIEALTSFLRRRMRRKEKKNKKKRKVVSPGLEPDTPCWLC